MIDNNSSAVVTEDTSQRGWFNWPRWRPTSMNELIQAEKKMMMQIKTFYETKLVDLGKGNKIWTYIFNKKAQTKTPLVMVHGFAGGVGLWSLNIDALSKNRTVFAFDLMGFGRSTRIDFPSKPEEAEDVFVESIENWRKANNINEMILMGHSFGGYLVSSYALKYPKNIKHLILADPWGFPEYSPDNAKRPIPLWIKAIATLLLPFNPLATVRLMGPWGPGLIQRFRGDLGLKFAGGDEEKKEAVFDYIYHCNAQYPTGETAFRSLSHKFGYAKFPMINRIGSLSKSIPVTFIYGARTWMDIRCGHETQTLLSENQVEVYSVKGAGHHVYADQPENFQLLVNTICDDVD